MKPKIIINKVIKAFFLLSAVLVINVAFANGADLRTSTKRRSFISNPTKATEILGAYSLQSEGRNGAYTVRYFEIKRTIDGKDYWMDWRINKYRSSSDQSPDFEWSSGDGKLKKGALEIQLTGDIASGTECYVSVIFSETSATVKSDGCTQKSKPDGVYTREAEEAATANTSSDSAQPVQETAPEEQEAPVENYYLTGMSPKLGKFENTLDITRNGNNQIFVSLATNWYKTIRRKKVPQYDLRIGDLKIKRGVAKGVLGADGGETASCEVTLTFTGKTIKLQTGKCDLDIPASGVYVQK